MATNTAVTALAMLLASDPSSPLVTFYDGASGERVELSARTFDNWVNKIANFFADELELEPGESVSLMLPTHWQSAVILVAAWSAGLAIAFEGAAVEPAVRFVGPGDIARADALQGTVVACSMKPLGAPFDARLPERWYDFASAIPPQPDELLDPRAPRPGDPALQVLTGPVTHEELVDQAIETAEEITLAAGGRLVTDANPARHSGLAAGLVAPLLVGASVVLTVNCDAQMRARIAHQEQVTAAFWLTG